MLVKWRAEWVPTEWLAMPCMLCGRQIKGARSNSLLILAPQRCFSIWLSASLVCKGRIRREIGEIIFLLVYLKSLAEFFLSWTICQPRVTTLYWKQEFPWQPASCSTNPRLSSGLWVRPSPPALPQHTSYSPFQVLVLSLNTSPQSPHPPHFHPKSTSRSPMQVHKASCGDRANIAARESLFFPIFRERKAIAKQQQQQQKNSTTELC